MPVLLKTKVRATKVRAHIGIDGNEAADKLAKEAADDEDDATPEVATPEEEHARFGWQTTDANDEPVQLRDADDVLKAVIAARYARIQATQPHSPAARWARSAGRDALRGEYSHGFLNARGLTLRQKNAVLQLRCNRWVGNALRFRWKMGDVASPRR